MPCAIVYGDLSPLSNVDFRCKSYLVAGGRSWTLQDSIVVEAVGGFMYKLLDKLRPGCLAAAGPNGRVR